MPFGGILEDQDANRVPGTVILNEQAAHSERQTHGLKHAKGHNGALVLIPQPSDNPNDPLNWSQPKKVAVFLIISFGTILTAAVFGPLLNAGVVVLAQDFGVTITAVTKLTGDQILVPAVSGVVVCAISRKYGKRLLFIISTLFAVIGSILCATAETYRTLHAGRIIQGFSIAAYESLCFVTIGDLFFVHERGLYAAAISWLLVALSNLASVVSGAIFDQLGWRSLFYILVAACGLQLVLVLAFVPETTYQRDSRLNLDEHANENLQEVAALEKGMVTHEDVQHLASKTENQTLVLTTPAKKTFWRNAAIFSGRHSDENLIQLVIGPFAILTNLAVLYVSVLQAWVLALFVGIAYTLAQIFAAPPYLLTPQVIGYLSLGPFVGGTVAMLALGPINDPIIRYMCRKNGGAYEPEYRLVTAITGLLVGTGLFLFGHVAATHGSYFVTATLHGILMFGVMGTVVSTSAYILDAYREMSSEIFIIAMVMKNFLFFGFSFFINDWLARSGVRAVYYTFGATAFGVMLPLPILYVFGKRYRGFWSRHNLVKKLNILTRIE